MLRSAVAVLAGLVVTLILVMVSTAIITWAFGIPAEGTPSPGYLITNLLASAVAGVAGGATALKFAPHTPHGHVIALAILILLLSLPTLFTGPAPGQPTWYGLVLSVLGPVSVLAGGLLVGRRGHAES